MRGIKTVPSFAKQTDLARVGKDTFDIDLGVYSHAQGQTKEQLSKLLPSTQKETRKDSCMLPLIYTAPAYIITFVRQTLLL